VHGANVVDSTDAPATAILKQNPVPAAYNGQAAATNLSEFCAACHDGRSAAEGGDAGDARGCFGAGINGQGGTGSCHATLGSTGAGAITGREAARYAYINNNAADSSGNYNGASHVMVGDSALAAGKAFSNSDSCRDCHQGGTATSMNSFPHYTAGKQFLTDGYDIASGDTALDQVCLGCHENAAGDQGVGKTY
jgi:hypothetical protein